MKVVFCVPTLTRPYQACLDSIKNSIPLIEASGWNHYMVTEIGNPYISAARSYMLRKAMSGIISEPAYGTTMTGTFEQLQPGPF